MNITNSNCNEKLIKDDIKKLLNCEKNISTYI